MSLISYTNLQNFLSLKSGLEKLYVDLIQTNTILHKSNIVSSQLTEKYVEMYMIMYIISFCAFICFNVLNEELKKVIYPGTIYLGLVLAKDIVQLFSFFFVQP